MEPDSVSIEIHDRLQRVEDLNEDSSTSICISKRHEEYVPPKIGLGLYHHADSLTIVQERKERALTAVAKICNEEEESLIKHVRGLLTSIKACYDNSSRYFTEFGERDQAKKFTMDACFIIQFFTDDWRRSDEKWTTGMTADIFMFENQIPLFLLLEIMELMYRNREGATLQVAHRPREAAASGFADRLISCRPFHTLLPFAISPCETIRDFLKGELQKDALQPVEEKDKCNHLLHLLNKCIKKFLSPDPDPYAAVGLTAPIQCHQYLDRLNVYNIKFEARNKEVWFENRWPRSSILWLPQITLDKATEPLHKNIMKFAQLPRQDRLICDLTFLMKCIVKDTNESLFREAGIIQGNGTEFSQTISRLCNGVTSEVGQYGVVIKQLEEHCKFPSNRWIYTVCQIFYKTASMSLFVAILSLFVAILSFVASILLRVMSNAQK